MKYEDYLSNNIFKPLGMRNSYYDNTRTVIANRAKGYVQMDTTAVNSEYLNTSTPYAAGGLLMTVQDLFLWHQALLENKLIKAETLKRAQTPYTLKDGTKTIYGFGWELAEVFGSVATSHSGSISGFATAEVYLPKENLFIATFCNRINFDAMKISKLAICLLTLKPIAKQIDLPRSIFNNYVGKYKFKIDQPAFIRVFEKNGKYYMQDSRSSKPWQMHFTSNTNFYCVEVFPNNHVFTKDASGKVVSFIIKAPGYESIITKIE